MIVKTSTRSRVLAILAEHMPLHAPDHHDQGPAKDGAAKDLIVLLQGHLYWCVLFGGGGMLWGGRQRACTQHSGTHVRTHTRSASGEVGVGKFAA